MPDTTVPQTAQARAERRRRADQRRPGCTKHDLHPDYCYPVTADGRTRHTQVGYMADAVAGLDKREPVRTHVPAGDIAPILLTALGGDWRAVIMPIVPRP